MRDTKHKQYTGNYSDAKLPSYLYTVQGVTQEIPFAVLQRRYVSVVLQVNLHFITLLSVRAERERERELPDNSQVISVINTHHIFCTCMGITLCILTASKVPYYLLLSDDVQCSFRC